MGNALRTNGDWHAVAAAWVGKRAREAPLTGRLYGRDALLGNLARQLKEAGEGNAEGASQFITGAPGSGKTALLREFADRCLKAGAVPVNVGTGFLGDRRRFIRRFLAQLRVILAEQGHAPGLGCPRKEIRARSWRLGRLIGLSGERRIETNTRGELESIAELADEIEHARASSGGLAGPLPPIVVLIDEFQNAPAKSSAPPEAMEAARALVSELHEGQHGLLVLPIYAGLSNSREVLEALGVSRLGEGCWHPLGRIGSAEAERALDDMAGQLGLANDPHARDWGREAARRSSGWPHHLTSYGRGLAQGVLDGCRGRALVAAALGYGDAVREQYYRRRAGPLADVSEAVAAALAEAFPSEDSQAAVRSLQLRISHLARPLLDGNPQVSLMLEDVWPLMLRAGLVQPTDSTGLNCEIPIPTMRSYLIERWPATALPEPFAPDEAETRGGSFVREVDIAGTAPGDQADDAVRPIRKARASVADLHKRWNRNDICRGEDERKGTELEVARALIDARTRAGLSQAELAARMRTTQAAVASLESGRAPPSMLTLERIARATGSRLRISFDQG